MAECVHSNIVDKIKN